jgi:hypothetical protein
VTHPRCSAEQEAVLARGLYLARTGFASLTEADTKDIIDAFGKAEARTIFATLGPASTLAISQNVWCDCSTQNSYCSVRNNNSSCSNQYDCTQKGGCGTYLQYICDGMCST